MNILLPTSEKRVTPLHVTERNNVLILRLFNSDVSFRETVEQKSEIQDNEYVRVLKREVVVYLKIYVPGFA
jgi:uncharacterized protein YqeY